MALSENARKVFAFMKEHDGTDYISQDIVDATGLNKRSVDGIVTSAFQKKGLSVRTPAEMEVEVDGKTVHKPVKLISLTDEGRAFDPDAE